MSQLARMNFTAFNLKVPQNWRDPQGDPAAAHYRDAFKPEEKMGVPGLPPLFQPATMNKYHVDTQKQHIATVGAFLDGITSAICTAWATWQAAATMSGILINGPTASLGALMGPPMAPLIFANGPKTTPNLLKYTNVVASVIGSAWTLFTATVKFPGLPLFPALAAFPGPMAPPTPGVPVPFAALTQVPAAITANVLKAQMIGQLGDPQAPFHKELFGSIAAAFEASYNLWTVSCMVNVLSTVSPIPTFAPPYVPVGPVVGGSAVLMPGGLV